MEESKVPSHNAVTQSNWNIRTNPDTLPLEFLKNFPNPDSLENIHKLAQTDIGRPSKAFKSKDLR